MDQKGLRQEPKASKGNKGKISSEIRSRIWLSIFISAVISFVPFTGYGYLKGYLWAVGFDAPIISPSIYDMVFYCLLAVGIFVTKFSVFSTEFPWWVVLEVYIVYLIMYSALVLGAFYFRGENKLDPDWEIKDWLKNNVKKSASSWRVFLKSLLFLPLIPTATFAFLLFCVFMLLMVPWLFGVSGFWAGQFEGTKRFNRDICVELDWSKSEEDRLKSCTVIVTNEDEELRGHKVYETQDRIYFITNKGAYELNQNMKVISQKEYINRPEMADG